MAPNYLKAALDGLQLNTTPLYVSADAINVAGHQLGLPRVDLHAICFVRGRVLVHLCRVLDKAQVGNCSAAHADGSFMFVQ